MRPRGADRPDGDADQRNEQPGKSRRLFGRARPEAIEPSVVPTEETGWLDDLRTAKQDRSAIGPGKPTDGKSSKSGKTAPAPDDLPDDAPPFRSADPTSAGPTFAGPTSAGPASAGPTSARPTSARPTSAGPTSGGSMRAGSVSAVPMSGNAPPALPTPMSPAGPRRGAASVPPRNVPGPAGRSAPPVEPSAWAPGPGRPPAGNTGGGRHATGEFTPVSPRDYTGPPSRPSGRRAAPDPDDSQELHGGRGGSGYTPRRGDDDSDHPMGRGAGYPEQPRGGASRPVSARPAPDGPPPGAHHSGSTERARPGDALGESTGRHAVLGPRPDGAPPGALTAGQHTGPLVRGQRPDMDGHSSGPVPGGPGPRGQGGQHPGSGNATGWRTGSDTAGVAGGSRGAGQAARATAAVVPPVVPGREGARTPAVPGRAGAMADSPSGVIQRPGETTGRAPGRVAGRAPGQSRQPGAGEYGRPNGPAAGPADDFGQGRAGNGPMPGHPGLGRPGEHSQPIPGRAGPDEPDQVGHRSRHNLPVDLSEPPTPRPGAAGPGGVRPLHGLAGAPMPGVPMPGAPMPGAPMPGAPGASSIRGTGAVAAVPGRVAAVASVGAAGVPPMVEDGRTPAKAAVRSATTGGHWANVDGPDEDGETPGGLRGELRAKLRSQRRLRVISLISLSILILGLLPLFFGIRAAGRDPVFNSLDALDVPGWAAEQIDDKSSGSRWCFLDCRFRERTAQSERPFEETSKAYTDALTSAGWQPWQVEQCPEQPISDGKYTCWRRDEFTLDLWVRLPECAVDAVAAQDPATVPSAGPDGVVSTENPADCVGSTVSIKVQNAITDQRGKPQQVPDPGLIGETPDPVPSNDPLLDPTPSPS